MTDPAAPEVAAARPARRWPLIVLAVVLVGALAFAVGRFSTFGSSDDAAAPSAADVGFARDMQMHHAQAVEMAMLEYRATEDDDLKLLAFDIATSQSQQSGQMFAWIDRWGLPQLTLAPIMSWMAEDEGHAHGGATAAPQTDDELRAAMGMASDAELEDLRAATGTAKDCLFVSLMIRHHTGAIQMIDAVQRLGSDPLVLHTAEGMGEAQTREIQALTSVQSRLGCR